MNNMKKSLYIWLSLKSDDGCQYVDVNLSGSHIRIYDLRSVLFMEKLDDVAAKFDGVCPCRYMLNIPARGERIVVNGFSKVTDIVPETTFLFSPVCKDWLSQVENCDLLRLIVLFLNVEQKKVCGFNIF